MPREISRFDDIVNIASAVIRFMAISEMPKEDECITPLKVFVYTKYIRRPMAKEMNNETRISGIEMFAALSRKLKLNNCSNMINPSVLKITSCIL